MRFSANCARACMDKSDKIGFKELQKNVTRQKLLDVVMEHIYFAAMYEEQSHLSFVVHEEDKEALCDSLELYGFKVKSIPVKNESGFLWGTSKLLISW